MQGGADSSRDVVGAKGGVLEAGTYTDMHPLVIYCPHFGGAVGVSRSVKAFRLCGIQRRMWFVPVEVLNAGNGHVSTSAF